MMLGEKLEKHQKSRLAAAAQAYLVDYTTDNDLEAFMVLYNEDFHALGKNLVN